MKKILLLPLFVLVSLCTRAQGPRVPNKMSIGDVQLKITDGARAEIQKNVDDLTRHPKSFNAKVDKANQYFHFIEEAFKKEGVPDEIKYLVLQESGLIADAVSTSNAVGYWQFKDFTAIEVGLRVDRHVDERKNIYAASLGAAKYMNMNNGYFDNWVYAIQAYQMGAGGALKVTDKKLYGAKSMTITKRTYWYVKKFIAHKVAYENVVGKSRPSIFLSAYKEGADKSLHDIAKQFGISEEHLSEYNMWLKKGKIPTDKSYTVIIPGKQLSIIADSNPDRIKPKSILVKKAPTYNQAQAKLFPAIKPWKGSNKYSGSTRNINRLPGMIGNEGDKLIELARKGNVSLSDFLEYNDVSIDHKVTSGTPYYFKKKKTKARIYYHIVQDGETFWSISQKYGVRLKKLLVKNRLSSPQKLKEGRVLWIRHIRPETVSIAYEKIDDVEPVEVIIDEFKSIKQNTTTIIDSVAINSPDTLIEESINSKIDSAEYDLIVHTVEKGNTYYNIANRYHVSVLDLVDWNELTLADKLAIGQKLNVYTERITLADHNVDENEPQTESHNGVQVHVVERGETLYSISRKYNLTTTKLKEFNNKEDDTVSIGEELKISEN